MKRTLEAFGPFPVPQQNRFLDNILLSLQDVMNIGFWEDSPITFLDVGIFCNNNKDRGNDRMRIWDFLKSRLLDNGGGGIAGP